MNNPLENILRDQKRKQRTFGITENLLERPVPRFYGAGDHKVQLAYITPDEAKLLADLDLHNSNPPNPGPEGIPNFNDPGTGMSGTQTSAAEKADRDRSKQERADLAVGPSFGPNFPGGNNQNQNTTTTPTTTTSTTTTPQDDTQYTNNFLDALFDKDLSFKFDPKMDYVDRVYGRLPNHIKNRIANKLGIDDFDSYLDANYESLYNQDNITGSDIANMFTSAQNYFTGIPNAIANYDPTMPTPEGFKTLGQKVFGGIFGNPVTTFMGMNPLGFPAGMFTSLVMNKGPFTKESIESGDFANLANAPADYQKAVQQAMGGTFSPEQMAQIASGAAAKAEQQANTKGGVELTPEEKAELQAQMDKQSIEAYKNTLTEPQLRVYERLAEQGYNDDYIRAYLGFL